MNINDIRSEKALLSSNAGNRLTMKQTAERLGQLDLPAEARGLEDPPRILWDRQQPLRKLDSGNLRWIEPGAETMDEGPTLLSGALCGCEFSRRQSLAVADPFESLRED